MFSLGVKHFSAMASVKENKESWQTLQKGQIAELAFERIALAHGYGVRYAGGQYSGVLLPSKHRKAPPDTNNWRADFELYKQSNGSWVPFKHVEVKWRAKACDTPSKLPPNADYLVLFTPSKLLCAKKKGYARQSSLKPIEDFTELGFQKKLYEEIRAAAESLLKAWPEV